MTRCPRLLTALMVLVLLLVPVWPAMAVTPEDYDAAAPENLENDHLYAESALLVDMDAKEVLLSKNSRVRMYPASTTKIVTLMLAIESGLPLDESVTIPMEAGDIPQGSSVIGIKPGDIMTWRDLLYSFMLKSGNDGSNAIAVLTAGSIPAFVERMNARVKELGCENTHFTNAHGYHDQQHYTTAQDLARISYYAMQNEVFREIVAAGHRQVTITRGGKTASGDVENRNSLLLPESKYYYEGATGIKTGHHSKAGWCVVASAERNGVRLMAVVLNCETEDKKWMDAHKLFNYGFSRYAPVTMRALMDRMKGDVCAVTIENAAGDGRMLLDYGSVVNGDIDRMVLSDSEQALDYACEALRETMQLEWKRALTAPVAAGEVLGVVRFTAPDGTPVSAELVASRGVEALPVETAPPEIPEEVSVEGEPSGRRSVALTTVLIVAALGIVAAASVALWARARAKRREMEARRRAARRRELQSHRRAAWGENDAKDRHIG